MGFEIISRHETMTRVEKVIEELRLRIQDVLWELEGGDAGGLRPEAAARGGGPLTGALERIQQLESTKLRVREAELSARRVGHPLASQLHAQLVLVYAELSTAEFAAKDALQKKQFDLIEPLIARGYGEAHSRAYQVIKDKLRELYSITEQPRSHFR